jgi:P27 family predicted phage terminase small subunit
VAGNPEKPTYLDGDASAEWDRLVAQLGGPTGVLCEADRGILEVVCNVYAMFMQTLRVINKHGPTYETKRDGTKMM